MSDSTPGNSDFNGRQSVIDSRCPVCLQFRPGKMTDGHIYPKLCRLSEETVRECDQCNNNLGSTVDSALTGISSSLHCAYGELNEAELSTHFKNRSKVVGFGGSEVRPIGGSRGDGSLDMELGMKAEQFTYVQHANGEFSVNFQAVQAHSNQLVGGLLHSGYLRMFLRAGFDYVSDAAVDLVRVPLAVAARSSDKEVAIRELSGLHETCRAIVRLPGDFRRLYLIRAPDTRPIAFCCFVPYAGGWGGMSMLPGPGQAGKVGYERVLAGVRGFVELQPIGEEAKILPENVFTAPPAKGIVARGFNLGGPDIEITIDDLRKYAKVPINFEVKKLPGR